MYGLRYYNKLRYKFICDKLIWVDIIFVCIGYIVLREDVYIYFLIKIWINIMFS